MYQSNENVEGKLMSKQRSKDEKITCKKNYYDELNYKWKYGIRLGSQRQRGANCKDSRE